jgi:uncharacterized protein (TIGR02996 family)
MDHDGAFREAVQEHPDDDLHRLAWADWLDDTGQAERAQFIRAQLRAASLPEEDPGRDAAEDEADDLLAAHEAEWAGRVSELALEWQWRRGCIEQVTVQVGVLLRHGEELFAQAPVREVRLLSEANDLHRLAGCSFLRHVEVLDVSFGPKDGSGYKGTYHRDATLTALLVSPHWTRLTALALRNQGVEGQLLQALSATGLLTRLRRFDLRGNLPVGDRALRTLAEAGSTSLEALDLMGTNIQPAGLRALLRSEKLPRLHDLSVAMNRMWLQQELVASPLFARLTTLTLPPDLGRQEWEALLGSLPAGRLRRLGVPGRLDAERLEALAGCANLSGLRVLQLPGAQLRDSGARILANSPHLGRLTRLNVGGNQIGGPGLRAIVNSPHLGNLRELELWANYVGEAGCEIIASAPAPRRWTWLDLREGNLDATCARLLAGSGALSRLRVLRLANNRLGDEGVGALAASPHLSRLRELLLDGNEIDSAGVEALLGSPFLRRVVRLGVGNANLSPVERERLRARFGQATSF